MNSYPNKNFYHNKTLKILPFLSALLDNCIERAEDCRKWSYYDKKIMSPVGLINVADGLAAMKRLVFEEKRLSMSSLLDALRSNREGKEDLRQMFLNAPKFGNDDDYVDEIAREVQIKTTAEMKAQKNPAKYVDLIVRIAGYSVYFVDLPKMMQDEIINRTEQELH